MDAPRPWTPPLEAQWARGPTTEATMGLEPRMGPQRDRLFADALTD